MQRRILIMLLVSCLLFGICGCAADEESSIPEKTSVLYYLVDGGVAGIMGFENDSCSSDVDGMLHNLAGYKVKQFEISGTVHITLPDKIDGYTVYAIDGGAFHNCTSIKSIVIPKTVEVIEPGAFDGCREDLAIYSSKDSEAHHYAIKYGIHFDAID